MIQTQMNERYLRIKALEHLIDLDFDTQRSCHEVCYLIGQLFQESEEEVSRMVALLAKKALKSSVDDQSTN